MLLSVVIVTCNRRQALASTLDRLAENPSLPHDSMEVLVVDNGSTDGTREAAKRDDLDIRLIARPRNEGVSARNHAFAVAQGEYLLLIDDDSFPLGDAAARSMAHLDANAKCVAVVGRIELPDGRLEASALPGVIANGAVVLRKSVIDEVGGFPTDFFRQAEEYDLSFRMWNAGYTVERFEDLLYRHEKVDGNRPSALIHRLDMRNNLVVADRYLPRLRRRPVRADWAKRYALLARHAGCGAAALLGRAGARAAWWRERFSPRTLLTPAAFESVFGYEAQAREVAAWARSQHLRRVVIADFGKNIHATWSACHAASVRVLAVADDHPAFAGAIYRGVPIVAGRAAAALEPDGVVLANVNPAQVERRARECAIVFDAPVLTLWRPRLLAGEVSPPADSESGLFRSQAA